MSKRKLLLADDSITIQKVVNLTFADEGIEVVSVGDGDAAMLKFNEAMPDLVLADVNMPGLDGYRMCEMIKQDDETKHIPVILLVGSFEPFDEQEAWRVGADDFLTKPFQSIRQLVTKVSDLLNPSAANQTETAAEYEPEQPINEWQLADTQEFPVPEIEDKNLGDTGMDDEMIQTSQVGEPADEMQKFISDSYSYQPDDTKDHHDREDSTHDLVAESFQNETDEDFAILETNSENYAQKDEKEDEPIIDAEVYEFTDFETKPEADEIVTETSKTTDDSPFPAAEYQSSETISGWERVSDDETETSSDAVEEPAATDKFEEIGYTTAEVTTEIEESDSDEDEKTEFISPANDEDLNEESSQAVIDDQGNSNEESNQKAFVGQKEDSENEIPVPMSSTVSFDDFDLLELPPLVEETGIRPQMKSEPLVPEVVAPEPVVETDSKITLTKTVAESEIALSFPPELIEAIAQKVAEKISDKAIREIAWEVVPQMTDLIVKKIAEEQLEKNAKELKE